MYTLSGEFRDKDLTVWTPIPLSQTLKNGYGPK